MSKELFYSNPGTVSYQEAWDLQRTIHLMRTSGAIEDTLLLLEHPHTYTLGKTADRTNLIGSEEYLEKNGISVFEIDRGGDITYHGPGQIVGYPIIDLNKWKPDTHLYLRNLEEVIIKVLAEYGIESGRKPEYTGVWVGESKIAAIGIRVSRWVTMHGFAFNINTDLELFNGIIPCGIKDKEVTSLSRLLKREINIDEVKQKLRDQFVLHFDYTTLKEIDIYQLVH
ncbi:MAG: lipoyl(octanoyl) transferase LipB [Ignavibacteriales bacterium]|nr:lipoyl(octanoyl) transferase LipB [Ignavibacteriales bacterium]MBK7267060.1 lipoyl(octanoyl) transferase LipB [Ignavibacteriales bacterium]MBK8660823.1 lipoyl(octanoyl) transferase LipB [Ignavibacteriales bacterium]MCC6638132.1 lipoyl(octanoyl) transferase LipB [Ignavibacteriaceae bacterium]